MTDLIAEAQAIEIAVRHVREKKIDGKFNGAFLTKHDGRSSWHVLIELNDIPPEAECHYVDLSVMVDATSGTPTIMKNL